MPTVADRGGVVLILRPVLLIHSLDFSNVLELNYCQSGPYFQMLPDVVTCSG